MNEGMFKIKYANSTLQKKGKSGYFYKCSYQMDKYKITFIEHCTVVDTIILLIQVEIKACFIVHLVST